VLTLWVVLIVGMSLAVSRVGARTTDNIRLPGTDGQRAADLLAQRFPGQENGSSQIVIAARSGRLTEPRYASAVAATVARLRAQHDVQSAVSPLEGAGRAALSRDGRIAYVSVVLKLSPVKVTREVADSVLERTEPAKRAGLEVKAGGLIGQVLSQETNEKSESVGLAVALVVLLLTFGTVVAMGLPIVTALLGLSVGLSAIGLLGHLIDVPTSGRALATMIGLGVGIDYALFILTRHLTELRAGVPVEESIARATATSGGAVVFAGATVIIALGSLAVAGIPIVAALGYTSAVAVLVAVVAAVTLLPASLAIIGPRIRSLRLPLGRHVHDAKPHGWARWARFVARRPWLAIIVALAALLALAAPALSMNLGSVGAGQQPKSTMARQAYDLLSKGFGPGVNGPLLVVAELRGRSRDRTLAALGATLRRQSGAAAVTPPQLDPGGTAALFTVIPKTDPSSDPTESLVRRLRADIATALRGTGARAHVGGATAASVDLAATISHRLPLVILTVIGLSFVLLVLAFRSVVVPLKAGLMNILAVGAAFGVVTAVFQQGFGDSVVGLDGSVPLASFVPLMMFAILFGLSMDYEVFLMSHIQEHYHETGDTHEAVVAGLAETGRVITSAALIMLAVFGSFVLSGDPTIKEFGLGLAVAVLVDATVVRCLLVPAVITKLGNATWWMPRSLARWTPRISIEGAEHFGPPGEGRSATDATPTSS
jgi:RND superfamily putative drug exporter